MSEMLSAWKKCPACRKYVVATRKGCSESLIMRALRRQPGGSQSGFFRCPFTAMRSCYLKPKIGFKTLTAFDPKRRACLL